MDVATGSLPQTHISLLQVPSAVASKYVQIIWEFIFKPQDI